MSCLRLHSRTGVPTAPRKYLVVTMVLAFIDHDVVKTRSIVRPAWRAFDAPREPDLLVLDVSVMSFSFTFSGSLTGYLAGSVVGVPAVRRRCPRAVAGLVANRADHEVHH